MKNFTKKLALLLVFAMVLGVVTPTSVARAAEEVTFKIDFTDLTIGTVKLGETAKNDYEFTQYVPKEDKAPTAEDIKKIKEKDWVVVDGSETAGVGDISWFNKKKASYAIVRIPNGDGYVYGTSEKIDAQPAALKVFFTKKESGAEVAKKNPAYTEVQSVGTDETGYLVFYKVTADKKMTVVSPQAVAYRISGGYKYTQIASDKANLVTALQKVKAKGATFMFVEYDAATPANNKGWAAAETKYKYAAQKAAPTAKIGADRVVALKLGQEYRFFDGTNKSEWVSVDENHATVSGGKKKIDNKILITDLICTGGGIQTNGKLLDATINTKSLKLLVRTAATDKTIASKISSTPVTMAAIDVSKDVASYASIEYKVKYDPSKGVEIKNLTEDTIEYAIVATTTAVGTTKWSAIKKEKTAAVSAKNLKDKDGKEYTHILIRKAGDKKAGVMASPFVSKEIKNITKATQTITAVANGTIANVGTYTVVSTGATSATATVSVAAATVSGKAIEKAKVVVDVTGLVESSGTCKYDKKGSNNSFKVYPATYKDGKVTFEFDIKKDTKASDSGEYKCLVEGVVIVFKVVVK